MSARHLASLLLVAQGCSPPEAPPPLDTDSDPVDTEPAPVDTTPVSPPDTEDTALPVPADVQTVLDLGPTVWLRAADLALGNGDPVASWPSPFQLAGAAVQAERFRQPLYRVGLASPFPVVRFDGVDDLLQLGTGAFEAGPVGDWTVIVVARIDDDLGHLVGIGPSDLPGSRRLGARLMVEEGKPLLTSTGDGQGAVVRSAEGPVRDGAFHIFSAVAHPRSSALFVDGRPVGLTELLGAPWVPTRVTLGASDGVGLGTTVEALAADVAEVLVFDRPLFGCDRWVIEQQLADRYGMPVQRALVPPVVHHVAADAAAADGEGVARVPARSPPGLVIGPLVATPEDARPQRVDAGPGGRPALRFDGVDDRMDVALNLLGVSPPVALTTVVVAATTDAEGFLGGAGPSVEGQLARFGAGFFVRDGKVGFYARDASSGAEVVHPDRVDDGLPRVLLASLAPDDLTLFVDGRSTPAFGGPLVLPLPRASLGAADGQATGRSFDPLAMELAELRQYRYVLDGCSRDALVGELGATYGVAP